MSNNLDIIILDDEPLVCQLVTDIVKSFYTWGEVHSFTNYDEALNFCKDRLPGVAIFILDVYLDRKNAFDFLEKISDEHAWAAEDTIMMTGDASDDIVNRCIAQGINYLIEKPIKAYSLKLAVRAIVGKYTLFAKRLVNNPDFAKNFTYH